MHYYLLVLSVVGGICLAFGVLFLYVSLRRRHDKQLSLAFSLFAIFYAGAVLTGVNLYSAASLADYVRLSRWDGLFVALAVISLVWFVAGYTGVRPRPFLWSLTAAYVGTGIANAVRANLIYDEIFGLAYVTLSWGEQQADILTGRTRVPLDLLCASELRRSAPGSTLKVSWGGGHRSRRSGPLRETEDGWVRRKTDDRGRRARGWPSPRPSRMKRLSIARIGLRR